MHPQVQTLLSMLGLQEERVAHPRVRDIDSRFDLHDNIEDYNHYIENVTVGRTATYIFRASFKHLSKNIVKSISFRMKPKYVAGLAELMLLQDLPITSSNSGSSFLRR